LVGECDSAGFIIIFSFSKNEAGKVLSHKATGGTGFAGGIGATIGVGPSFGHLVLHANHHEENDR
jgi:hypothetical protein